MRQATAAKEQYTPHLPDGNPHRQGPVPAPLGVGGGSQPLRQGNEHVDCRTTASGDWQPSESPREHRVGLGAT